MESENAGREIQRSPARSPIFKNVQWPLVIAIANQKGGVGKSTLTCNLAASMAHHFGIQTAIIDLDPNANATRLLLDLKWGESIGGGTIWTVVKDYDLGLMNDVAVQVHTDKLVLIPGDKRLYGFVDAHGWTRRQTFLREFPQSIRTLIEDGSAEVVLMDTPPADSLLTQAAMLAADAVFAASMPTNLSELGLGLLEDIAENLTEEMSWPVRVNGVMVTNVEAQTVHDRVWVEEARRKYGNRLLDPIIPHRVFLRESETMSEPVEFNPSKHRRINRLRGKLRTLAKEVVLRTQEAKDRFHETVASLPETEGSEESIGPEEPVLAPPAADAPHASPSS